jgi:hypothetical protein
VWERKEVDILRQREVCVYEVVSRSSSSAA